MSHRCCQSGLVSVWTVPQDPSSYSQSSTSCPDAWWESESKSKLMVMCSYERLKIFECFAICASLSVSICVYMFYLCPAGPPAVWRSSVCAPAAGSHDSCADSRVQSRWACSCVWRGWWTFEHLVVAGQCLTWTHTS